MELKQKKIYLFLSVLLVLIFSSPGTLIANYYQFVDDKGNICFTDNLADVPKEQREHIESFSSVDGEAALESSKEIEPEKSNDEVQEVLNSEDDTLDRIAAELRKEKQNLNEKMETLNERQMELKQKVFGNMSSGERQDHKKKVKALNREIRQYKKQREAFRRKLAQYNKKVRQKNIQNK